MPNGDFVDVGHVLAGLDAINHPTTVAPYYMYEMASNVDAVTWAGDLGSVLAECIFQAMKQGRPLTDAEIQAQIDEYAPTQDMLGNVDAYAIGDAFDVAASPRQARLRDPRRVLRRPGHGERRPAPPPTPSASRPSRARSASAR